MAKERAAGKNRRPSLLLCIGRGYSAKKSLRVKGGYGARYFFM